MKCYKGELIFTLISKKLACAITSEVLNETEYPINMLVIPLRQGSPTPRLWTGTSLWPDRDWSAQQEVSGGRVSEVSSVFTAAPYCLHFHLRYSHRSTNPTVHNTCEGARLCAPYEILKPNDPRWS